MSYKITSILLICLIIVGSGAGYYLGNSRGYQVGFNEGNNQGYINGKKDGLDSGYKVGLADGKVQGYDKGHVDGRLVGYAEGMAQGNKDGQAAGYQSGFTYGKTSGYTEGFSVGDDTGYERGVAFGNSTGYRVGFDRGYTMGFAQGVEDTQTASAVYSGNPATGSNLRNPRYQEMIDFLSSDSTDSRVYSNPGFICVDFASTLTNDACELGISCHYVEIYFANPKNGINGHALNGFDTTDRGFIFVEPQTDMIVDPRVGGYYQGYPIAKITIFP